MHFYKIKKIFLINQTDGTIIVMFSFISTSLLLYTRLLSPIQHKLKK